MLLSYIDDLTARMYFLTRFISTGARLNEALALRPADFILEPSRKYPQAVVTLRALKQRNREATRRPVRPAAPNRFTPIRATANHLSRGSGLCRCSMPPTCNGSGNTLPPGVSAYGISPYRKSVTADAAELA